LAQGSNITIWELPLTSCAFAMPSVPEVVIESYFKECDADTDGAIEMSEYLSLLDQLGFEDPALAERLWKSADANQSGTMSLGEFKNVINEMPQFNRGAIQSEDNPSEFTVASDYPDWFDWVVEMWQYYDTDKSGSLSSAEFQQLKAEYDVKFTGGKDWSEVDADHDGRIDFHEFMRWLWKSYSA